MAPSPAAGESVVATLRWSVPEGNPPPASPLRRSTRAAASFSHGAGSPPLIAELQKGIAKE